MLLQKAGSPLDAIYKIAGWDQFGPEDRASVSLPMSSGAVCGLIP